MIKDLPTSQAIDKWCPTTQECPCCFKRNKVPLSIRTYRCTCGFEEDRDVKAAKTILCYALYKLLHPLAVCKRLPVEALSDLYSNYNRCCISLRAEAAETGHLQTLGLDASDFSPR
jgi:Putative transposase DNA-binding domain